MTKEEAKESLSFHSCRNENSDDPRFENGFLGSLRPFKGQLDRKNLDEVMECLRVLKDEIAPPQAQIDRNIVCDITSILHLGRGWAETVLSKEQTIYLNTWLEIIESCWCFLLDGADDETAFLLYKEYLDGKAVHYEITHLDGNKMLI